MIMAAFEVTNYVVHLGPALSAGWRGTRFTYQGKISCRGSDNHRLVLYFLDDDTLPHPDADAPDAKFGRARFPLSHMSAFIDLVRHERPVFAHLNEEQPELSRLSTSEEPVGESEEDFLEVQHT
jgi:phosphoribosyl 1,2-cyclic phosphodiesterase